MNNKIKITIVIFILLIIIGFCIWYFGFKEKFNLIPFSPNLCNNCKSPNICLQGKCLSKYQLCKNVNNCEKLGSNTKCSKDGICICKNNWKKDSSGACVICKNNTACSDIGLINHSCINGACIFQN